MEKKYDIFLSYSTHLHKERADALFGVLVNLGYSVWYDRQVLGRRLAHKIPDYVGTARAIEEGILCSTVTVLFEMQGALKWPNYHLSEPPNTETKEILARGARDESHSFSWQEFEYQTSKRVIVIGKD